MRQFSIGRSLARGRTFETLAVPIPLRVAAGLGFLAAISAYLLLGGWWWSGLLLLFAPDLAFVGFLAGPVAGVAAYNAIHRPLAPALLLGLAALADSRIGTLLTLAWLAHIAMDRAAGYGLKGVVTQPQPLRSPAAAAAS